MKLTKLKALTALVLGFTFIGAGFISCSDGSDNNNNNNGSEPIETGGAGTSDPQTNGSDTNGTYDDSSLSAATIWVVGDSTVCDYTKEDGTLTDATYFYPRYGYGTQFYNYFSTKITVKNLALSGRSSKSFLEEANYTTLKNEIKAGDFLVIGFGHNDEKSDDATRFTDASKPTSDSTSFKYSLYENYVKIAENKGATAILCSPIVRASSTDDYTGSYGHVTATGDYGTAVVELGQEKNVQVVNLRDITAAIWKEAGYNEAIYFHAMTSGVSDTEPKVTSVDTTHVNIYGAKRIAYEFAKAISQSNCALKPYVDTTKLTCPTKANDLVKNSAYKYVGYSAIDWTAYSPADQFKTKTAGWYGTAFGDCGGDPSIASNGYYATETSDGVFKVGQTGTSSPKGKITSSSAGFALAFRQISISRNFTLTAKAKVLTTASTKQAAFGLMLRDDCYVPANDKSIVSNFVAAGILCDGNGANNLYNMSFSSKLSNGSGTSAGLYAVNDTAEFTIKRLGQVVTVTTVYKGNTYTDTYTDFDFVAKDNDYFYAGMFATRGTSVEFTDITLTDDGESQGA